MTFYECSDLETSGFQTDTRPEVQSEISGKEVYRRINSGNSLA